MVVQDIAKHRVFKNPTEPQLSITGIYNNLHSKGVPELSSASYHYLNGFVGIVEELAFTLTSISSTGKQNIPVPA